MGPSSRCETTHTSKRLKCSEDVSSISSYEWSEVSRNTVQHRTRNDTDQPVQICTDQSSDLNRPNLDLTTGTYLVEDIFVYKQDALVTLPVKSELLVGRNKPDDCKGEFERDKEPLEEHELVGSDLIATKPNTMVDDSEMINCTDQADDYFTIHLNSNTKLEISIEDNNSISPIEEDLKLCPLIGVDQHVVVDIGSVSSRVEDSATDNLNAQCPSQAELPPASQLSSTLGTEPCHGNSPASTVTESSQRRCPASPVTEPCQGRCPASPVTEPCQGRCPASPVTEPCQGRCPASPVTEPCQGRYPASPVTEPCQGRCPASPVTEPCQGRCPASPVTEPCQGRCPASLQQLSVKAVLVRLGSGVWKWRDQQEGDQDGRKKDVADFRKSVPAHIRQLLQEAVLEDWRVWDTVSLRLLQLLLAADCCSSVRVQQVRLFFRDSFLRLLAPLTRLTDLRIQDSDWTLSHGQEASLCLALSHMPLLRLLSLRHIATDAVLTAAVRHCPNLLVLDLLCSRRVTCSGVLQLPGRGAPTSPHLLTAPHRRWLLPHCCVRFLEWVGAAITHRSTGEFSVETSEEQVAQCQCKRYTTDQQERSSSSPGLQSITSVASTSRLTADERRELSGGDEKAAPGALLQKLLFLDLRGTSVSVETAQHTASALPQTEVLYLSNSS